MTQFVSIYADGDSGKVVTVTKAFAEGIDAKVLEDVPATDRRGRPLPARDLPKPSATSVKDILAEVGNDRSAAQQYLNAEQAKGEDARPSLVEKLQAVIAADSNTDA